MKTVTLKIFRFDSSEDPYPRYKTYELSLEESMTLLMALRYIYEKVDNTLAFRNYCCGAGPLCGSCLLTVNGKPEYSCSMSLRGNENLIIEPLAGFPVIKDLVVDWGIQTAPSRDYAWEIKKCVLVTRRADRK